jgi:hypothetical protein
MKDGEDLEQPLFRPNFLQHGFVEGDLWDGW